jgi:capsular exopolysaccharide synthesis family protein
MGKIYDALSKTAPNEISDTIGPMLEDQSAGPVAVSSADIGTDVAAVLRGGDAVEAEPQVEPKRADRSRVEYIPVVDSRTVCLRVADVTPVLPFDETDNRAAEQYRIIRTRLISHPKQPVTILISSAGPGDGKSVSAINVAGALSLKTEARVLLMDADFRRSSIHTQLGISRSPGIAEVLTGAATLEQAIVRSPAFPNLYIAPAGEPHANPSELLDSTAWRTLSEQVRGSFRYVIMDSPPVGCVADYELLQAACDGVVLVVRPDHTKRQACLKALSIVPKDKLLGVIMNCVSDWPLGHDYSYMYYQKIAPAKGRTAEAP